MKVVILAGGWGSRLGNRTEAIPKPMVAIGGKPIIWHIMKYFSFYGLNEFIICLGVKAEVIKNYFYNYKSLNSDFTISMDTDNVTFHNLHSEKKWKVTLVDTGIDTLKGGRIKRIEKYLDSETNMLTYGDGVIDLDIQKLLAYHTQQGKVLTITGVHPAARFGELIEKDGTISFEEKPQTSKGLINGGFMVFNRGIMNYLIESEDCDFEHGALEKIAKEREIALYKHDGNWECMDHERDVKHLNELWKNNNAFWKVWK